MSNGSYARASSTRVEDMCVCVCACVCQYALCVLVCVCVKDHLYVNETPRSWDDRGNSRRLGRQSKGQEGVDGV